MTLSRIPKSCAFFGQRHAPEFGPDKRLKVHVQHTNDKSSSKNTLMQPCSYPTQRAGGRAELPIGGLVIALGPTVALFLWGTRTCSKDCKSWTVP